MAPADARDARIRALEETVAKLQEQLLQADIDRGQLMAALAEELEGIKSLQQRRFDLVTDYQRIDSKQFANIERVLRRHESELRDLRSLDWEENTDVRELREGNEEAEEVLSKAPSISPERAQVSTAKWGAIAKVAGAVSVAVGSIAWAVVEVIRLVWATP